MNKLIYPTRRLELSELLNTQLEKKERRRQISHRQWEENVYEPVSQQIRSTFDAEYEAHQARRDKAYDDYIEVSVCCGQVYTYLRPLI